MREEEGQANSDVVKGREPAVGVADVAADLLPASRHPSDHLPLAVDLVLLPARILTSMLSAQTQRRRKDPAYAWTPITAWISIEMAIRSRIVPTDAHPRFRVWRMASRTEKAPYCVRGCSNCSSRREQRVKFIPWLRPAI